jgi:hypothetical protein
MELRSPWANGFDKNSAAHFLIISNELQTTRVLVCRLFRNVLGVFH